MRRLGAGIVGGILTLSSFVGANDAGEPTLTAFYLSLVGTVLGLVILWYARGRHGLTWRWSHSVAASIAGALGVSVVTVAVINPEDSGGLGFAIGGGLGWGLILGFCAALLVYALGFSKSAKSTPAETDGE